ncbi:MAG: hypothetical protein J5842_00235 [Lachnospiraceae bacterium]|nr:hypothetical protein [Lachnospiraceae bacterium]
MESKVKMVPALCTQCGGTVEVNASEETAKCPFCGASFIIEKAVNNYNVQFATIEHADNVNIDVRGAVKDVLGFVGEQMNESRKERREIRKEQAGKDSFFEPGAIKVFVIMFACMTAAIVIISLVSYFIDGSDDENAAGFSGTSEISDTSNTEGSGLYCYIENGCLFTDISGSNLAAWKYSAADSYGTALVSEENGLDHYTSCVSAGRKVKEGEYYVITAAYEDDSFSATATPLYYSVVKVTVEDSDIVAAADPVIVDTLSEYDFD